MKELPSSIDVGIPEIDGVLKSTANIIAQGKEALLAAIIVTVNCDEIINNLGVNFF